MKKAIIAIAASTFFSLGAWAGDEELCLDCHEPAEDWEGMSVDEIVEVAADTSIKRHADNADLSDEELQAIIAKLMAM